MSAKKIKKANGVKFAPDTAGSDETTISDQKKVQLQKNPNARSKPQPPAQYLVDPISAFYIFLSINTLAALYAPIQDCDEVFNFWEPTHYLNRGFGLQTWEYSPEFSIRSWTYVVLHAIPGKIGSFFSSKPSFEFYFIRALLGIVCTLCETRFFTTVSRTLNPRIGVMLLLVLILSPGMFHASVAYLPSSLAMYTTMLGTAAFMDWRGGLKTNQGIMWFGIGAMIGWPFSAALIIPFIIEEFTLAWLVKDKSEIIWRFLDGTARCLVVLALQIATDMFFYHKIVVVPWRIVMYNVFSGSSRGPNIFGTEPWHFYIQNLLLNFNLWFLLAMSAGPLLGLQSFVSERSTTKQRPVRSMVFIAPFYLWLLVFSAQAHKEERFMYPAYPLLALNAAIALHSMLGYFGTSDPKSVIGRIPPMMKLAVVSSFVACAISAGALRTVGLVTAYRAPFKVYEPLARPEYSQAEATVCLGKEWYRFPSSYFLPKSMRAKFIKSEFDGLLPGQYNEAAIGFGLFPGTWLVPPGMNDENVGDPGKYIDVEHCTFLMDSEFPGVQPTALEPNYIADYKTWEELQCSSFLDSSQTALLGRIIWLPDWKVIPASPDFDLKNTGNIYLNTGEKEMRLFVMDFRHCLHILLVHARPIIYIILLLSIPIYFITTNLLARRNAQAQRPPTPDLEKPALREASKPKAPERTPGVWTPVDFKRPAASPYPDWDVHKTEPLPYRPVKYGAYHITMGLRMMHWDDWIELDNQFPKYHALKTQRIAERGEKCCRTAPEAYDGAVELLEELADYLPQRYPSLYTRTQTTITNLLTHETFSIQPPLPEDPMATCGRLVQDDLAIMFERPDGQYYLLAGSILLAGFWRLQDKFGMPLSEIHTSGNVPGFKTKLEKGMMNFFRRIQPAQPVLRNNYFIQVDDELAWSSSIGAEDAECENGQQQVEGWSAAQKNKAIEHHHFRSERQSLRRLPRSGGVVFTIRTYFEPVTKIAKEKGVPGRLASGVRSWGEDTARYKGREKYGEVLLEYLDRCHREHVERGEVTEEDLGDEAGRYPF